MSEFVLARARVAADIIGKKRSRELHLVPLDVFRGELQIGMAAEDATAIRTLRRATGLQVRVFPMTVAEIRERNLDLFGSAESPTFDASIALWNDILFTALERRSANVLIEFGPIEDGTEGGRIRIDSGGVFVCIREIDLDTHGKLIQLITSKAITGVTRNPSLGQRGKVREKIDGREIDLRVSTYPMYHPTIPGLVKIAVRIQRRYETLPRLEDIVDSQETLHALDELMKQKRCSLIIGAPPNEGKTVMFMSLVLRQPLERMNVYEIGDPPEIYCPLITQTPIAPAREWSYEAAINEIFRQTPDFCLIDETLDPIVAKLVVSAHSRGVPTGTTIHSDDALTIIKTLTTSMSIERESVATGLTGLISTRLVNLLCPSCAKTTTPHPTFARHVRRVGGTIPPQTLLRERNETGCEECIDGIIGRRAIAEVLFVDADIADAIRTNDDDALAATARRNGFITMLEAVLPLIFAGIVAQSDLGKFPDSEIHAVPIDETHDAARAYRSRLSTYTPLSLSGKAQYALR
jgi:type II secretory ATPase GspE/PulE/Tfp pilus assembly ATPase PilB-like protein